MYWKTQLQKRGNNINNEHARIRRGWKTWTCLSNTSNHTKTIHTGPPPISDPKILKYLHNRTETILHKPPLGHRHQQHTNCLSVTLWYLCEQHPSQSNTFTQTYVDRQDGRTNNSSPCRPYRTPKRFLMREPRGGAPSSSGPCRKCYKQNFSHERRCRSTRVHEQSEFTNNRTTGCPKRRIRTSLRRLPHRNASIWKERTVSRGVRIILSGFESIGSGLIECIAAANRHIELLVNHTKSPYSAP